MNNRPDIEELLCDYVDGTLDPARRQEVEAILAADADLRKSVRQMQLGRDALKALPVEKLPQQTAGEIQRHLHRPAISFWQVHPLKMAAAVLLTCTLAALIWSILPGRRPAPYAADLRRTMARTEAASEPAAAAPPVALSADQAIESKGGPPAFAAAPPATATPSPMIAGKSAEGMYTKGELNAKNEVYAKADVSASALMYVRSSDIPAVQREINQMFAPSRMRETLSNASPDVANAPLQKQAPKPTDEKEYKAQMADRFAGAKQDASAVGAPAAPLASDKAAPAEMKLSGVTPGQMQQLLQNVLALSPSNRVEIVSPEQSASALGSAQRQSPAKAQTQQPAEAQQQRADMQQQALRQMPSASAEDLQRFAQLREQSQMAQQRPALPSRYDLTIIIEPQSLPQASGPATFPATAPGRKP